MHSTQGPSGQTYHHNGGYSGLVRMYVPVRDGIRHSYKDGARAGDPTPNVQDPSTMEVEVEIPFEDMKALVLAYYRGLAIDSLEGNATAMERLLFPWLR